MSIGLHKFMSVSCRPLDTTCYHLYDNTQDYGLSWCLRGDLNPYFLPVHLESFYRPFFDYSLPVINNLDTLYNFSQLDTKDTSSHKLLQNSCRPNVDESLRHRKSIKSIKANIGLGGDLMDVTVKILKWEKHNPRKDIKKPTWFALDNRLVEDDDFFDFNHGEFKAWIYLMSKASEKHNPEVRVSFEAANRKSNISPKDFKSAIEKLKKLEVIQELPVSVQNPYADVRDPNAHVTLQTDRQDITLQDITDRQSITTVLEKPSQSKSGLVQFSSDEELWDSIPTQTMQRWMRLYNEDDPFIRREVIKAYQYYNNNPRKLPKTMRGWIAALSSWLERGWPNYLKRGPAKNEDPFAFLKLDQSEELK